MSSQDASGPGISLAADNTTDGDHYPERPNCDCPLVSHPTIDLSRDDRGLSIREQNVYFSKFFASRDLMHVHQLDCKMKDLEWTLEKNRKLHNEAKTALDAIEHIATQPSGAVFASLQSEVKRLRAVVSKLNDETEAIIARIKFATDERARLIRIANNMGLGVEKLTNPNRADLPMQHAFEILVRDVHEGKIALHESEKGKTAIQQELDYEKQCHAEEITALVEERDETGRRKRNPTPDTYNHEGVLYCSDVDIPVVVKKDALTIACMEQQPDHYEQYFDALFQHLCIANALASKALVVDISDGETKGIAKEPIGIEGGGAQQ